LSADIIRASVFLELESPGELCREVSLDILHRGFTHRPSGGVDGGEAKVLARTLQLLALQVSPSAF